MKGVVSRRINHIQAGEPLTESELATVGAYVQCGGYLDEIAGALCIHRNTAKYRIQCIKCKWGMRDADSRELLVRAVRWQARTQVDGEDLVRRFVLWASPRSEQGDYFGLAVRLWLNERLEAWEQLQLDLAKAAA